MSSKFNLLVVSIKINNKKYLCLKTHYFVVFCHMRTLNKMLLLGTHIINMWIVHWRNLFGSMRWDYFSWEQMALTQKSSGTTWDWIAVFRNPICALKTCGRYFPAGLLQFAVRSSRTFGRKIEKSFWSKKSLKSLWTGR